MANKLLTIKRIDSVKFYTDIYRYASSLRYMWIFKPRYIRVLIISFMLTLVLASFILGYISEYVLTKEYNLYKKIEILFYPFSISFFIFIFLNYKLSKKIRPKQYDKYLYNIKKERMLNNQCINQLIEDIDLLIELEKEYTNKVLKWYRNFTLAAFMPIVLYAIQLFLKNGTLLLIWIIIIFYFLVMSFNLFKAREMYPLISSLYIPNFYIFFKVKQELEYMKTIKID